MAKKVVETGVSTRLGRAKPPPAPQRLPSCARLRPPGPTRPLLIHSVYCWICRKIPTDSTAHIISSSHPVFAPPWRRRGCPTANHRNLHCLLDGRDPDPSAPARYSPARGTGMSATAHNPQSSAIFASSQRKPGFHHFTVNKPLASKILPISEEPDPPLHLTTFLAGHPRLRSTKSKPKPSRIRAAHHSRIAAKKLRRDRMLVFIKMQIKLLAFLSLAPKNAIRRRKTGHNG